ncbi:hypothetical protein HHI36_022761 [Cryptolaemus montrouzieri]|uniref:Uncharacterized protein n=1 Tax=Cryptolaemus montrouzieri TaxID=559131 RepID=A0ABD2N0W7_9CUCU
MADYQTLIKELRGEEVEFYTYSTKDQLRKKLVIKTAAFVTEEDLKKQLSEVTQISAENVQCTKMKSRSGESHSFLISVPKQVDIRNLKSISAENVQCTKMKSRSGESHSFLISVPKQVDIKNLKSVKEIDRIKVNWQKYNKAQKVTQCHRCQKFGHGSSNSALREMHQTRKTEQMPTDNHNPKDSRPETVPQDTEKYIKGEYNTQYSSTQIKIHTKNMADYQTLIKELRGEEVEFYTYSTKDQLRKKLVIKTAAFVTEEDLKKQLSEVTQISAENVQCTKMKSRSGESHSFLISVPKQVDIKNLKSVKEIDRIKVNWQKYNKAQK